MEYNLIFLVTPYHLAPLTQQYRAVQDTHTTSEQQCMTHRWIILHKLDCTGPVTRKDRVEAADR